MGNNPSPTESPTKITCSSGYIQINNGASCQVCAAGYYALDVDTCSVCPVGKYSAQQATSCTLTPSGTRWTFRQPAETLNYSMKLYCVCICAYLMCCRLLCAFYGNDDLLYECLFNGEVFDRRCKRVHFLCCRDLSI